MLQKLELQRLRWSSGSVLAFGTKFAGSNPAEAVGFLRVNKNPQHVCCDCCVLSGRGLYDELITRPEESDRLWCVVVCDP